ncbi:NADPH-dependent FMN reductase [Tautonia plasticadhaerens]|uniref:FMN-dependent NADPH-azoreductase n=1 Tax=Tautonia plasticadhaerens TaxID=2527974 RepID=A0A518HAM1_9BACT|nr:NADPH-dependent FMN reductase [Tautonia plasticadhaerens]QDV37902.1 FMN-dependent NADPH-azoreductase [Tautonia plasticadhaerens]
MGLDLLVIYGSVRTDRQGIRAARFVASACEGRGHRATLIDPKEVDLPLLDRMYKEYPAGEAPSAMERLAGQIREADAFIIVSGEYNHSIPPALSNLLDHYLEEWLWRPSAIVCYSAGSFGGVRAGVQLRAMLGELGMPSIPSMLPVPRVGEAFEDDGTPRDDAWHARASRFLGELEWYAEALKQRRASGVPY